MSDLSGAVQFTPQAGFAKAKAKNGVPSAMGGASPETTAAAAPTTQTTPAKVKPGVSVVGVVNAPIQVVWDLFRPFGPGIMRWWPIFDWVKLETPGIDQVGAVRYFKANGREYRERLVERDENAHREVYEFLWSDARVPLRSVTTTVQMVERSELETEVHWSSVTKVKNPVFLPLVHATQRTTYYNAIQSLARYFNPPTEILELQVVKASTPRDWVLLPPSAYVSAQVADALPQRTSVFPLSTRPRWGRQTLSFNLGVRDQDLSVALWSSRLGKDRLIGTARVNVRKVLDDDVRKVLDDDAHGTNGSAARDDAWTTRQVALDGPNSGELTIRLRRQSEFRTLRAAMSQTKAMSGPLGKLVPPLKQLGLELGMVDTALANIEQAVVQTRSHSLGLDPGKLGLGRGPGEAVASLLSSIQKAAGRVQRTIEGITDSFLQLSFEVVRSIREGDLERYEYARYERVKTLPDVPLENLPRMVKGLPRQEFLPPAKFGGMVQRGLEYLYSEFDLLERYRQALLDKKDPFEAFFGGYVVRNAPIVDHWTDDVEFCRQLIQGTNPMVIRMVNSMKEIPAPMAGLHAQGKSLQALIEERRLFILDYVELAKLRQYKKMVFYAPIVLVYREILDHGSRLNLLGIQLTREPGHNLVYTRSNTPEHRYLYAKIQVACADNQYHQFIYHLGLAHLAMEPFVIAHHNAFWNRDHKIGMLLAPHMRQTIGINYLARQTLVAKKAAFTDDTFSPGTAQALQLFLSAWEKFDFVRDSFPEQLAARGFDEVGSDGVQDYYYRDDGFRIWRAIEQYAREVVEITYDDDAALLADEVLQNWAFECSSPNHADIPGFPRAIISREQLTQVLTNLIFRASAYHSAVNFPQKDYLTYVPNRPDSTFERMPPGDGDITMDFIRLRALPPLSISNFQISFALLLTLPADENLANLPCPHADLEDPHRRFLDRLGEVQKDIAERNRGLQAMKKQPYPYLSPEQIAASVAI